MMHSLLYVRCDLGSLVLREVDVLRLVYFDNALIILTNYPYVLCVLSHIDVGTGVTVVGLS